MKKEIDLDFDFGFSFIDDEVESAKEQIKSEKATASDLQERLDLLHDSIIPFLDNLCKNPDKSTIHWPNRVEKIEAYKKRLEQIVEGNIK